MEINRGYLPGHYEAIALGRGERNESAALGLRRLLDRTGLSPALLPVWRLVYHASLTLTRPIRRRAYLFQSLRQALTVPVLLLAALVLIPWLWLYCLLRGRRMEPRTQEAMAHVGRFVEQYPFHFYGIVAKSLELVFLRRNLADCAERKLQVLECAIGEGSFSAHVFPPDARVVGLDLNPNSLYWASRLPHCRQAVVCDCLEPPVRPGSFDLVVANNLLHHISNKERTLLNWARAGGRLVFNEDTEYWAKSWFPPFFLGRLGLKAASALAAAEIERHSLQALWPLKDLDELMALHFVVEQRETYLSEKTFALCGFFSFLMGVEGPPTPPTIKRLCNGPLRPLTHGLIATLAQLIIRYDQWQDRAKDVYVSYVCSQPGFERSPVAEYLLCPVCREPLSAAYACPACARQYPVKDGILFLLEPALLERISGEYSVWAAQHLTPEHL